MSAHAVARTRIAQQGLSAILASVLAAALLGCEADSFLDPSVVGRWEYTPTVVPILERIDIIEPDDGEFVETSPPTQQDLMPEAIEYEVGPGDLLTIEIFDLIQPDVPSQFDRIVDAVGAIDLPQLGRIRAQDLTLDEIREAIRQRLRERELIVDALVSVQLSGPRQRTFKIYGAIAQPGRYLITEPDYRLLDGLTEAGGVSPIIRSIRVIRQIPLDEAVEGALPPEQPDEQAPQQGADLLDLIDQLSQPEPPVEQTQPPSAPDPPNQQPPADQPTDPPVDDAFPAVFGADADARFAWGFQPAADGGQPASDDPPPAIDLIDAGQPGPTKPAVDLSAADDDPAQDRDGSWMFLNGEWVQVVGRRGAGASPPASQTANDDASLTPGPGVEDLITQRVIEVPTRPLIEGAARYNIVIRPDDIIYVPPPPSGNIYVAGPGIARPGTYNLPANGRITLTKAIVAAGGLSPIGIPERVDLTRMVGPALQATIRLDLRAIFQGTEPDVFLKPDDLVNVGTNFWAQPLAIIRNGFRMSYGFGFLLDRNFGNDVFGAPPSNVGGRN